jgi:hypothetical protein
MKTKVELEILSDVHFFSHPEKDKVASGMPSLYFSVYTRMSSHAARRHLNDWKNFYSH